MIQLRACTQIGLGKHAMTSEYFSSSKSLWKMSRIAAEIFTVLSLVFTCPSANLNIVGSTSSYAKSIVQSLKTA